MALAKVLFRAFPTMIAVPDVQKELIALGILRAGFERRYFLNAPKPMAAVIRPASTLRPGLRSGSIRAVRLFPPGV
jgi:hypothetical protein